MRALLVGSVLVAALAGAGVTIEAMGYRRGQDDARAAAAAQEKELVAARHQVELQLSQDIGRLEARNRELEDAIADVVALPGGGGAGLPADVVRALARIR